MHELFGKILEQDPSIVFVTDPYGTVLYGNRNFLEIFAPKQRRSVLGTVPSERLIPDDGGIFTADNSGGDRHQAEMVQRIVDWTGRVRTLRIRKYAISTLSAPKATLTIATDMTELAAREDELVAARDRLREWASVASHDLRSPIGSYATAIAMIQNDPETVLGAQSRQYLDLIANSASDLVQQLTAMIQRERGETDLGEAAPGCDLNLCLAEVRSSLAALMTQSRVVLNTARLPTITGDPSAFRRLFQNLFENSIRRRAQHAPRIVVRYDGAHGEHRFCVEDNGRPMSAEAVDALERPLEDGEALAAGIGLVQCQRAVALHGGRIVVDPKCQGGCRVVIHIPARPAAGLRSLGISRVA